MLQEQEKIMLLIKAFSQIDGEDQDFILDLTLTRAQRNTRQLRLVVSNTLPPSPPRSLGSASGGV
jgi:hypothetical protein